MAQKRKNSNREVMKAYRIVAEREAYFEGLNDVSEFFYNEGLNAHMKNKEISLSKAVGRCAKWLDDAYAKLSPDRRTWYKGARAGFDAFNQAAHNDKKLPLYTAYKRFSSWQTNVAIPWARDGMDVIGHGKWDELILPPDLTRLPDGSADV